MNLSRTGMLAALVLFSLSLSACRERAVQPPPQAAKPPEAPVPAPVAAQQQAVEPAPQAPAPAKAPSPGEWTTKAQEGKELFAVMKTSKGDVTIRLFTKDAPKTVANFVGLATGEREYTDPVTGQKSQKPFYDGTVFHRVIPDFMIQGGDRTGTGRGDPGYSFEDEFQSGRKFDKVGLLAMANAGPNTNGSQFFITTSKPEYLNNRHTIFGEVISGYPVVESISKVERNPGDRPLTDVVLTSVTISDKAPSGS